MVLTIVILFAMTSAWYTNVVHTSGLVFKAESWGFDGNITLAPREITAGPGDVGLVNLVVENDSDSISAISINVSKTVMQKEMQQRLFFYVDTHMNRSGETMDRVYLNNHEGYTYTVFSNGTLSLTEQSSNAPQLKWHWVYDMLGYYVMAKPVEDENGNVIRMTETEYLRPIEYNLDDAITTIDTEGESPTISIATVDGETTPLAFLTQLSLTDGYEGVIDASDKIVSSQDGKEYYAVDVDDRGYGVYAYLCNYTEIEEATRYDTLLGELAYQAENGGELSADEVKLLTHEATLRISAQKNEATAINVSNLSGLESAIQEGYADVVQLSSNITIPAGESLTIPADTRVMVDLNNYTLTGISGTAIKAEPGSSLTLLNGDLVGPDDGTGTVSGASYGVYATGAEVVMSKVDVSNFRYGVYMGDNVDDNELDSRVHMVDCTLDAQWYAVFINGNGLLSEQKTQLIIEDSILTSDGMVITGNGTATGNGRWGTDIQILNSKIQQTPASEGENLKPGAGIYQPQKDSSLYIYNSTVSGYTAIAVKGGSVDILDSTIAGEGLDSITPTSFGNSGFTDTADAVYIETNYEYDIQLTIRGTSVLTSTAGKSLRVYEETATNVLVQIESGTFDEAFTAEQAVMYFVEGAAQSTVEGKTVVKVE